MSQILNEPSSKDNNLLSSSIFPIKRTLKNTRWRWLALLFLNLAVAGNYYCYDNPQALQTHLQYNLQISAEYYDSLYSVYCLPNIILPLIGGRIIDIFGVRVAILIYSGLVAAGQTLTALGGYLDNFYVIFAGRAIYGFGGDCLTLSETVFVTEWFTGKELAFAFSFQDVINGLFSGTNSVLTPLLYDMSGNLGLPLFIGAVACIISFVSALVIVSMDKMNDKIEGRQGPKTYVKRGEGISIKNFFNMPFLFWLIILNFGLQSGSFYNFTNVANDYISVRYSINSATAGKLIGMLIYGVGGLFPPFWGKIIDTFGRRVSLIFIAATFPFTCNLLFLLDQSNNNDSNYFPMPVLSLLLMGLYISGSDSLTYPSFPVILPSNRLATAYSAAFAFQNLILSIYPVLIGIILDRSLTYEIGYNKVSLFLCLSSFCGILIIAIIYWKDKKSGSRLQNKFENLIEDEKTTSIISANFTGQLNA